MSKKKTKLTTYKFTSTQGDWLKQFVNRFLSVEDSDPDDASGEITKFIEDTYNELVAKYEVEDGKKDLILPVCFLLYSFRDILSWQIRHRAQQVTPSPPICSRGITLLHLRRKISIVLCVVWSFFDVLHMMMLSLKARFIQVRKRPVWLAQSCLEFIVAGMHTVSNLFLKK